MRSARDGRAIEEIGFYDPRHKEEKLNLERAEYWISQGAQVSETVGSIIKRAKDGVKLSDKKVKSKPSKKSLAKAAAAAEAAKKEAEEKAAAAAQPAEEAKEESA
jgi:small subunit ribosomal protein S16